MSVAISETGKRRRGGRSDHNFVLVGLSEVRECEATMGKQRSSLRQVPWQSWEHWDWVATELFSESPERISGALDRIAAWQSRGKVPIAVETSAAIIGIHQRDPQFNHGILKESALPEAMLRMMYAMAIQRLVNGVVDPSQKRNTRSVADRAEFAGLSRLLVDIRHEAAHTELPGLALLQVASRQALAWLKSQYWDQQKETLLNVRLELKSKLVEHCLLVVDILNPSPTASELQESEGEHESKSEELPELVLQGSLRGGLNVFPEHFDVFCLALYLVEGPNLLGHVPELCSLESRFGMELRNPV